MDVLCIQESGCCCVFIPLFLHFFFLSNFQTLKYFVTLFSGTVRPRRLKLGTHVDWADVLCISGCCCIFVLLFFIFLSNFQTLKFFVTLFSGTVRPRGLKLGTHMDNGGMYRVYRNHATALIHPFIFFIFLSLQFSNIKIFCQFSRNL